MTDRPAPLAPSAPPIPSGGTPIPPRAKPARRPTISIPVVLIGIALVASAAWILYVVREVEDEQIPLLSYGFAALGACFVAIAIGCVIGMWRAAARAEGGRSFGLALVGGFSGLAAIGSFTVMALLMFVWNT